MGLHVSVETEKLKDDNYLLRLLKNGFADRFDVAQEQVWAKMSKYHAELGKRDHDLKFHSSIEEIASGEPLRAREIIGKEMQRSGYYESYAKVLASFPVDLKKIREHIFKWNTQNEGKLVSVYKAVDIDDLAEMQEKLDRLEGLH